MKNERMFILTEDLAEKENLKIKLEEQMEAIANRLKK
jgi:hypothetical protein